MSNVKCSICGKMTGSAFYKKGKWACMKCDGGPQTLKDKTMLGKVQVLPQKEIDRINHVNRTSDFGWKTK